MENIKSYTLGFCFSEDKTKLALITKNKPDWMKGLMNGIGGKIELLELPYACMVREFREETGVLITDWHHVGTLKEKHGYDIYEIFIYKAFTDEVFNCTTTESEIVTIINVNELGNYFVVPNLMWLIPLCLHEKTVYTFKND